MTALPFGQFQPRELAWSNILVPLRKSFINLESSNYIKEEEQLQNLDAQIVTSLTLSIASVERIKSS